MKVKTAFTIFIIFVVMFLSGCNYSYNYFSKCTVIFEENPNITISKYVYEVDYNSDLSVSISIPVNLAITDISYDNYSLSLASSNESKNFYYLTLYAVIYPPLITFTVEEASTITYIGEEDQDAITQVTSNNHLASNTLSWQNQFSKDGYVAIGWNTLPNNQGEHIGFGSRIFHDGNINLYPEFIKATEEDAFSWHEENNQAIIDGYNGHGDLIIPSCLGGLPVTRIAKGAFANIETEIVFLLSTLQTLEEGAFQNLKCEDLYLFDNLQNVSDSSFSSYKIKTSHVNAVLDPVYSKNYFATFADKVDYLKSIKHEKKIIFFIEFSPFLYNSIAYTKKYICQL